MLSACRVPVLIGFALLASALTAFGAVDSAVSLSTEAIDAIESAVVYIHVEWKGEDGSIEDSWGTGFFVSEYEVVTNHHVIAAALDQPGTRITVRTHSGQYSTRRYEAYVKANDVENDLALLAVRYQPPDVTPIPITDQAPAKNVMVLGFGFPMGDLFDSGVHGPGVALRRGYVSRITENGKTIEADMNIDHGMSGGPVTGNNGLLMGMVTAMGGSADNPTAFAFLISSATILQFLEANGSDVRAAEHNTIKQPGVEPGPGPGERSLRSYFSLGSSLRVNTLVTGLFAERSQEKGNEKSGSPELVPVAVRNIDNIVGYLRELKATKELWSEAEKLRRLVEAGDDAARAAEIAAELERKIDQWVASGVADSLEKLNYDFGAWVMEMKLGLIDAVKDRETCSKFQMVGELQSAPEQTLKLLGEIQTVLTSMGGDGRSVTGKETVAKHAEKLIAIGYLGPGTGTSTTTTDKSAAGQKDPEGREGTNRIRMPLN